MQPHLVFVTGTEKISLIYIKYTYVCKNYTYLLFCMCYTKSVSFTEFHIDFCMHDDIFVIIKNKDKKLLHFKHPKLGHVLHVDNSGFPRPNNIYIHFMQELQFAVSEPKPRSYMKVSNNDYVEDGNYMVPANSINKVS